MDTIKSSIEYVCSSIGLMTAKQCEILLKLKKEINILTNRLYSNLLKYRDIFDVIEKENSVKNISKVSDLLEEFESIINNQQILKLIYGNIQDNTQIKYKITDIYYGVETVKLLNKLYKDYCYEKKYYDIKHLYDRPCSEAVQVILEITSKNKEITEINEKVERIISELKPHLTKNVLEIKSRLNYPKKEKKEYHANILDNEYYLLSFYLSKHENLYEFYNFAKYNPKLDKLDDYFDYEYLDSIDYEEELKEEEKENYHNLRKNIDQIIEERGEIYSQYLENVSLCFPSNIKQKYENLYLLIDNTSNNLIFSFNIDKFNMMYDLCKTKNTKYKDMRMSDLLKAFLIKQKKDYYIHLDFNEFNFEKVLALFIRSGFSLKGPTSLPNEFILDEYTKNKRYLLLSYNPKKIINYNSLNTENLLAISNNIREYETKMKVKYYELGNFSVRKILRYLYNWAQEISGSFTQVSKSKINVLENLDENINLNNGLEMTSTPILDESIICQVSLLTYDIINYHTHALFCYLNKKEIRYLNPPSRGDIDMFSESMINEYINSRFKCHLVFTLECIYTIQIHPFWIKKLKDKSSVFVNDFFKYLNFLIYNFKKFDLTFISIKDPKRILELLYFYNNKFNFNELSKDTKHLNAKELTEHPSTLTKEEDIRQWYKAKYYSSDLDRNMNILLFSIIPYNWHENSNVSKLNFTEIPKHMFEYLKTNNDEIPKLTQYVQGNLNNENIKIPYYYF